MILQTGYELHQIKAAYANLYVISGIFLKI